MHSQRKTAERNELKSKDSVSIVAIYLAQVVVVCRPKQASTCTAATDVDWHDGRMCQIDSTPKCSQHVRAVSVNWSSPLCSCTVGLVVWQSCQ